MCAIVDTDVRHELYTPGHEAGAKLYSWLAKGRGHLVVGGTQYRQELLGITPKAKPKANRSNLTEFPRWMDELVRAGVIHDLDDSRIDQLAEEIEAGGILESNDSHIIALAQESGARLLFSNDSMLQTDFKNSGLLNSPRGKVYTTKCHKEFRPAHKRLLGRRDLCNLR